MRNLRNVKHTVIPFSTAESPLTATAWDATDDSLICAFGPSEANPALTLKRLQKDAYKSDQARFIASWDAPSPNPDLPVDAILDMHYFSDTRTTCLVLAGGDLIIVREEPLSGEDLIEIVGSVDAGISAAQWSPDEELLVLATKADTILFMTREFESTANIPLSSDDVKVSNHVSVGWGKSETQFKGRGAKALRDPTVPEHVDEGHLCPNDTGDMSISWRGDGAYVAVNSVLDAHTKRRMVRVYSREGALDSVSEPVNGLEGALSWKPSGNLIAGLQRLDDQVDVVLFERNGLRHGEFSLRLTQEEVDLGTSSINLRWNVDSSVLLVALKDRIQLWIMGNYHWYLKQDIRLPSTTLGTTRMSAEWHPEKPLQLALLSDNVLFNISYASTTAIGPLVTPKDLGLVAVIDGRSLKMTPLRKANVPPPMALEEVLLPDNASDVAISSSGKKFAALHHSTMTIWDCDYDSKPLRASKLDRIVELSRASGLMEADNTVWRQICFRDDQQIAVLSDTAGKEASRIDYYSVDGGKAVCLPGILQKVITILPNVNHDQLLYQTAEGTIYKVCYENFDESPLEISKLPTACPRVEVWQCDEQSTVFGLSSNGTLFIRGPVTTTQIPSCTSFLVTQLHLIYTSGQHLLKFIHLHNGELEVPPDEPEKDERCRNIERGAKLVSVIPSASSLVLQMPRGNIETIYPRALVLAGIRRSIANRDYKLAFSTCRTHRVDMNILHDYAPGQFIADITLFIKQIRKVEHIDLFLSSLSEENVVQTMYRETMIKSKDDETNSINGLEKGSLAGAIPESKVNRICDGFIDVLESKKAGQLQNLITAHVCKNPPDLEAGLSLVRKLKNEQPDDLEDAVEHICFLADSNQLYDTALGMYDLEITLLVAQQSQKDPREYLPYLQGLQEMQPLRQRFAIDNDLKRYSKALAHLHGLEAFEELKSYMQKHELYGIAMNFFRYDMGKLNEIMRLQAGFLSSRNRYKEAGIAYEYLQDYASAYEAYRAANQWRECLSSATFIPLPEEELATLAYDLAEGQTEAKDFSSAATIQLEYLNDLDAAARSLCKGYFFAEAIRVIGLWRKPELLANVIDPGLIEGSASMTELLADMKSQLNAQVPRLRDLRRKKAEDPMAFIDGAAGDGVDVPDNISLAPTDASTSGGTFMTRYTNQSTGTLASNATRKTSKNRRREERKRARGKKGTVYEEEYLVNSIRRLIERVNAVSEEVTRLVEGLMRRAMRERAVAVEAAMLEVVETCNACISEVFEAVTEHQTAAVAEEVGGEPNARPWGGQGVLWEAVTEAGQKKEPPVVKAFERLSLLT